MKPFNPIKNTGARLRHLAMVLGLGLTTGTALAAPANDDFDNAIALTGGGFGQTGDATSGTQTGTDNLDATLETGEPNNPISSTTDTVWFKWTSPADGDLTVNTLGSTDLGGGEWDAVLGIYTGASVNALTALGDSPQDGQVPETMTVPVTTGTTYRIQTSGWNNTVAANILLSWNFVATVYEAEILSFGPDAIVDEPFGGSANIAWTVPFGTNLATLAPTFTLSPGATTKVNGSPVVSGSTVNFSGGPVDFVVTAQGASPTVNTYTVTVSFAPNESALVWNAGSDDWDFTTPNWIGQTSGDPQPFSNALNVIFDMASGGAINIPSSVSPLTTTVNAASGTYTFSGGPIAAGSLTKSGAGNLTITTANNTYSGGTTINDGQLKMDVLANAALGTGPVTLNGGVLFLERITADNALIVNGGNLFVDNGFGDNWNGPVTLNSDLIIGGPGYATMTFNGSISGAGGLTLNGQGPVVLAVANTYNGPTSVTGSLLTCSNADALGSGALSISSTANSKVKLNYSGTKNIAALTLGGVPQTGGTHGSSASPATYKNDTYFDSAGTGTVTVPGSSAKNMLTFSFGALGAGTIGANTITLEVPFGTNRTNLAPTYTVSPGASGSPVSGTPRNFTSAQNYTVTAEDLSTKNYTVTVTEAVLPDFFTWASSTSGGWSVPANWTNELATNSAPLAAGRTSYTLNFDAAGTYTATNDLSAGFKLNQLNLRAAASLAGNGIKFTANGLTLPTINQNSGSAVSISNDLDLGSNTAFSGSGNGQVSLTGLISGAGSLTKDGSGILRVYNVNNSFVGSTVINTGTLFMDIDAKLGSGPITLNGGILYMWRFKPANPLIVNGGSVTSENGFNQNRFDGPITLNATLICNAPFQLTCNNTISGVGGLTKNGGGLMILSNTSTSTYSGPTTVTGGTLRCDSTNALSGSALSITSGQVNLNYSGTKTVASLSLGGVSQTLPGTYGSVLSGADNQSDTYFAATGTGLVTIGGGSDYSTWLSGYTFAPGADTTPTGDPDGDGMTNQGEYAFGLNPTLGSSVNPIVAQLDPVTGNFQYTRRATPAATKLAYTVLTSANLTNWVPGGATETGFTTAGIVETVTVHVTTPPVGGKLFVRVKAVPTP